VKIKCKECESIYEATIFDHRDCCGIGGACRIISFSLDEFVSSYHHLRRAVTANEELRWFENSKLVLPLNGTLGDTADLRSHLVAQILINEKVYLDSTQFYGNWNDSYLKDLVSKDLLRLAKIDPLNIKPVLPNECSLLKEESDDLHYVLDNLQNMIMESNYDRINLGQIIPGWVSIPIYNLSQHGILSLISRSDLVGVDNFNFIAKTRISDADRLGWSDTSLIKEAGLDSISIYEAKRPTINTENQFLVDLGLRVPSNITISDLIAFRKEGCAYELRKEFEQYKAIGTSLKHTHVKALREKIRLFNRETQHAFETKTLFLSGALSTLGGMVGGTIGNLIGGIGGSCATYYATKSRNNLKWAKHLHSFIRCD